MGNKPTGDTSGIVTVSDGSYTKEKNPILKSLEEIQIVSFIQSKPLLQEVTGISNDFNEMLSIYRENFLSRSMLIKQQQDTLQRIQRAIEEKTQKVLTPGLVGSIAVSFIQLLRSGKRAFHVEEEFFSLKNQMKELEVNISDISAALTRIETTLEK